MNIPAKIIQGNSATWKDVPTVDNLRNPITAPSWVLVYSIRGATGVDLTATADVPGWSTSLSKAQSAALAPGNYYWQADVTNGIQKITIGNGKLCMIADLSAAPIDAAFDGSSQTEKDLIAVRAAIRAMSSGGAVQKYVIANRQVEKMSVADLITLENRLMVRLKREQQAQDAANGKGNSNNTFVRF